MRQWRIKFFASLCLLAFLAGLMLGKLLKPDPAQPARLLQVDMLGPELDLCFSRLPKAAVIDEDGVFAMLFAVEQAEARQGILSLPEGDAASWRLTPRSDGMQLGIVSLQPLQGRWERVAGMKSCIRVSVSVRR